MGDYTALLPDKQSASRSGDFPHVSFPTIIKGDWIVYPLPLCQQCVKSETAGHIFLGRQTPESDIAPYDNPISSDQRTDLDHWRKMQYLVHKLHRIAAGLYASSPVFLYNAPDGNNFCNRNTFEILDVSGATLTLSGEVVDPRAIWVQTLRRPRAPEDWPPLWSWVQILGCIQANDHVTFPTDPTVNQSVIAGRVNADIVSIDVSGMDGSPKTFTVTLDCNVSGAMTSEEDEPQLYVYTYRQGYAPEDWLPIVSPYWLPCVAKQVEYDSGDFPADNIFSLKNQTGQNCRVAIPKDTDSTFEQTIRVQKRNPDQSLVDITSDVLPYNTKKRFAVIQTDTPTWESKLYLGTVLSDGGSGTDLLDGAIGVIIDYYCEATQAYYHICQGRCRWDTEDLSGQWGESYADRKWFCALRKKTDPVPTGLSNYTPGRCYQVNKCSEFEENIPFSAAINGAQFFDELHHAVDIRVTQMMAGISSHRNFIVHRVKHPSLHLLAGIFKPETPITYFARSQIIENGNYGRYAYDSTQIYWITGAIWEMPWAQEPDFGDAGTYPSKGLFPYEVTDWYKRREFLKHAFLADATDPFYSLRSYQGRQAAAINRDVDSTPFQMTGEGQGFVQRCGEAAQDIAFPKLNLPTNPTLIMPWGTITIGSWTIGGIEYGAKIEVNAMNNWKTPIRDKAINFGSSPQIYSAAMDGDLVKIECAPGTHIAGYLDILGHADNVFAWQGGGNIVELPDYLRIHNYYHPEAITGSLQDKKAQAGDTLGVGAVEALVDRKFFIEKAEPCAGTEANWQGQTCLEYFDCPGYYFLNTTGDDAYKPVKNVTCYNETDSEEMTEIVSLTKPDLDEYEFWVDYYTNMLILSHAETGHPTGDEITITYDIDEEDGATDLTEEIDADNVTREESGGEWTGNAYSETVPTGTSIYAMNRSPNPGTLHVWKKVAGGDWEELDPANDPPGKDEFHDFTVGDDTFIKFHYYNAGDRIKAQYLYGELNGDPPWQFDKIYKPLNYEDWGNKRDVLWLIDENGLLEAALAELPGKGFTVSTDGKISPYETPTVSWSPVAGAWTQISGDDLLFYDAEGIIYIKKSAITAINNA